MSKTNKPKGETSAVFSFACGVGQTRSLLELNSKRTSGEDTETSILNRKKTHMHHQASDNELSYVDCSPYILTIFLVRQRREQVEKSYVNDQSMYTLLLAHRTTTCQGFIRCFSCCKACCYCIFLSVNNLHQYHESTIWLALLSSQLASIPPCKHDVFSVSCQKLLPVCC